MANKARSKKRKTPRVVKPHPNAMSPMPISIIIIIIIIIINERYNMCCQRNNGETESETGSEKRLMINLSFSRL